MNKKKIHVGTPPLTGTIFAGPTLKDGMWAAGKQDVTRDALVAVAQHCVHSGMPVEIMYGGSPRYRITVGVLK